MFANSNMTNSSFFFFVHSPTKYNALMYNTKVSKIFSIVSIVPQNIMQKTTKNT